MKFWTLNYDEPGKKFSEEFKSRDSRRGLSKLKDADPRPGSYGDATSRRKPRNGGPFVGPLWVPWMNMRRGFLPPGGIRRHTHSGALGTNASLKFTSCARPLGLSPKTFKLLCCYWCCEQLWATPKTRRCLLPDKPPLICLPSPARGPINLNVFLKLGVYWRTDCGRSVPSRRVLSIRSFVCRTHAGR